MRNIRQYASTRFSEGTIRAAYGQFLKSLIRTNNDFLSWTFRTTSGTSTWHHDGIDELFQDYGKAPDSAYYRVALLDMDNTPNEPELIVSLENGCDTTVEVPLGHRHEIESVFQIFEKTVRQNSIPTVTPR
jgi:hypothetical protein